MVLMFAELVPFSEAFPSVDEVDVEVTIIGYCGITERNKVSRFNKNNIISKVICPNPQCYNGGVSLGKYIRRMVTEGTNNLREETPMCEGYEGSQRKRRRNCTNLFQLNISIRYKGAEDEVGTRPQS